MPRAAIALVLFLILFSHAGLLALSMQGKSPTIDEPHHLTIGLMTLASGDFRMCRDDPPLQNLINAAPVLLFYAPNLPFDNENWHSAQSYGALAHEFVQTNREDIRRYVWIARCATVGISLGTCALVFLWARELFGKTAALTSTVIAAFEPTLLAHGRLITTDTLAAFFFIAVCYVCWQTVRKPTIYNWISLVVLLGAALATKHSLLFFLPFVLLSTLLAPVSQPEIAHTKCRHFLITLGRFVLVLLGAGIVLWAIFGFEIGDSVERARPPILDPVWSTFYEIGQTIYGLFGLNPPFGDPNNPDEPIFAAMRSRLPLYSYWESLFTQAAHARRGHWANFLGEVHTRGWWYYYPVLFLTKTTIPFLILSGLGVFFLTRNSRYSRIDRLFLLGPPLFFVLFLVLVNRAAIGIRHLMPILPVLCVVAGAYPAEIKIDPPKRLIAAGFMALLLGWHVIEAASSFPHYIPYYNQFVGGPANGISIATDSNLDWGQDLPLLKREIEKRKINELYFIYFGSPDLISVYGLNAIVPEPDQIGHPGWWAISATCLSGIGSRYTREDLSFFRSMRPEAVIGYSIYLYYVTAGESRSPATSHRSRQPISLPQTLNSRLTECVAIK